MFAGACIDRGTCGGVWCQAMIYIGKYTYIKEAVANYIEELGWDNVCSSL